MKTLKEVLTELIPIIDKRMKNPKEISGVPTGHRKLDYFLDGLQPEFYIVGGRPSMGKSAFVKGILLNSAQAGHQAHIVNIEDGNHNTVLRMLSEDMMLPLWKLKRGKLEVHEYKNLIRSAGDLAELPITFDDTVSKASNVKQSIEDGIFDGAKLVVVDYLQLIQSDNKLGTKKLEQVGEISNMLKTLSKEAQVPILSVAQLNRSCEQRGSDKRPILSDLRECGEIEQDADVVMFVYRDSAYTNDKTDKTAELLIRKGRNVGTGNINFIFDGETTTFTEI